MGGCSTTIIDLDGNSIEAVYQPGLSEKNRPSPSVKQHEKMTEYKRQPKDTENPRRNSVGSHGKTVLGTLVGVAAGAFVAYKMYNKSSEEEVPIYGGPVPQVIDSRPPQRSYGPVQPPSRQLAIEGAEVWNDNGTIVSGARCQTVVSEEQKAASIASAMEGLENSTAAWSINDDNETFVSKSSRRPRGYDDSRSIASSRASSFHPGRAPSTFISDFDARTVTLQSQERIRPSGSRRNRSSSRAPPSRVSAAPTARTSGTGHKTALSRGMSEEVTLVSTKAKSILKPPSVAPSKYTSREDSVISRDSEATHATHKSHKSYDTHKTERTSRSHRSRSHARSRSHVSRRDCSPSESSRGEEPYRLLAYPAYVAPGRPLPSSQVYMDESGYDSEGTATATDIRAASRASKGYIPRAHRHHKSHRSHSVSGSSRGRRSRFDEDVHPDDSVSQVC